MKGDCQLVSHPSNHEHIDDQMVKMEVNLDDIPGEWLGYVMDLLFEAGANDVFYTPIYMKKNRPGVLLQLLCSQKQVATIKEILFKDRGDTLLCCFSWTGFRNHDMAYVDVIYFLRAIFLQQVLQVHRIADWIKLDTVRSRRFF